MNFSKLIVTVFLAATLVTLRVSDADAALSFPAIVFVSRNPLPEANGDLPGLGPKFRTAVVGGKLMLRERNGKLRVLVDSAKLIDVADPCVSWDAKRVVFSGLQHADSSWRIFEATLDGQDFRQLTFSDRKLLLVQFGSAQHLFERYDDFDPCYLSDGKIVFASTRYPSMAMSAQVRTSNLYVMHADGSAMHRITSERSGAEEPTIDPVTGAIVYSRWWVNVDLPSNATRDRLTREPSHALTTDNGNIWHAITLKPDGTGLKLYAGFMRTRFGSQTYKPALLSDGRLLSVFSPGTSLMPNAGGWGIRWFEKGASHEHHIVGLNADESLRRTRVGSPPFATDPVELTRNSILFAYSEDGSDYGIYACALKGSGLKKIVDLVGTLELEPQIVAVRQAPPSVPELMLNPVSDLPPTEDPETYAKNDFFRFDCMNIFSQGKVDEPMPDAPRIAKDLTIQFFMNSQRQSASGPDPSILLKTAPVFFNGGVHEHDVPAEAPLFEQIVDNNENVLTTSDGRFAHVAGLNFERQGSGTKCVGCHIGHSMLEVPKNGADAEWFNAAPSAEVAASSELHEQNFSYPAGNVVDRQAQMGGDSVLWIAEEGVGAHIELHWSVPIEAKQFILYGIPILPKKKIVVQDCRIVLYYHGIEVGVVPSTGRLNAEGTSISIPPTKLDAAKITITKLSGTIHRRRLAGIAEVETIARLFSN
ncbi:MAG: hypothetical protein HY961_20540 [Ignavibacteriae bacterium]|nr:hypothetical protein [Ignavibacteriota bacterium]